MRSEIEQKFKKNKHNSIYKWDGEQHEISTSNNYYNSAHSHQQRDSDIGYNYKGGTNRKMEDLFTLGQTVMCPCGVPKIWAPQSQPLTGKLEQWNSLPDKLRDPSLSIDSFRRQLKTFLFVD